jgi:hypothetical protein
MQRCRVMRHGAEYHVIGFRDGSPNGVVKHLPHLEFFVKQPGHSDLQ